MSTHELNRAKLALAAAGALPQEELLQVEQHARQCPVCLRELEVWSVYARGLGQLPQPTLPLGLVARTQAKVLSERADAADRRRDAVMLGFLAAFSWASSVAFWVVARKRQRCSPRRKPQETRASPHRAAGLPHPHVHSELSPAYAQPDPMEAWAAEAGPTLAHRRSILPIPGGRPGIAARVVRPAAVLPAEAHRRRQAPASRGSAHAYSSQPPAQTFKRAGQTALHCGKRHVDYFRDLFQLHFFFEPQRQHLAMNDGQFCKGRHQRCTTFEFQQLFEGIPFGGCQTVDGRDAGIF